MGIGNGNPPWFYHNSFPFPKPSLLEDDKRQEIVGIKQNRRIEQAK
jgi:hypothetical protein